MNKTTLTVVGALVLLAAAAVGYWAYTTGLISFTTQPAQPASPAAPTDPGKLTWSFQDVPTNDPVSGPQTKVTLTAAGTGKKYDAGTHTGSCFVIETSAWKLLPGEKTGAICWWAGGGTEIGVFEESGKLVIKSGDIEESTEETPGFRGNFKFLFELN
jgi:hypothetical protein